MAQTMRAPQTVATPPTISKPTLFDVPVSNNGARCRYIIYKKNLESVVDIQSPKVFGGLKTEAYLSISPQGMMPVLALPDGTNLPESQVIASYLADKYAEEGPSFALDTPELRANDALAQRVHDLYIVPVQKCMYKEMDIAQRADLVAKLAFQLDVLDKLVKGPYVSGSKEGLADAALFPTLTFCRYILPSIFGWEDLFKSRLNLGKYWATMEADQHASKVIGEIEGELAGWTESKKYEQRGIVEQLQNTEYKWSY